MRAFLLPLVSSTLCLLAQNSVPSHCVVSSNGAPSLPAKLLTGQGQSPFPISTRHPEAQKFFEQGVAQMHSFWAREAERSFLQAAALDPEAPMPWWGVAMVAAGDYRPHFQLVRDKNAAPKGMTPPLQRAVEAAKKAQTLARNGSARERAYIDSIAARRQFPLDDAAADAAYVAGLRAILAQYPDEVEAATYLALHLMDGFLTPSRQPRPGSMEAVRILKELATRVPNHPGVHHYVIHGWEGSSFAKDAWTSCERYTALVPEIPHALHMPGHIYSQTGKLQEAAASFVSAGQLERAYMKADPGYGNLHHGHNIHYLAVVQAAAGNYDDALQSARELLTFKESAAEAKQLDNSRTAYRQGWFALLRTLVWAERWDALLDSATLPVIAKPREQAWTHWARGLAYAAKGEVERARLEARGMRAALKDFELQNKTKYPRELGLAEQELHGHITLANGNVSRGLKILSDVSQGERALRYNEPPYYPRPVAVAWADAAARAGKRKEAEQAYRIALEEFPAMDRAARGLRQLLSQGPKPGAKRADGGLE
jgi:tetratricopeptide (TPR) repeat protein